jgi:hypothetical protein
MAISVPIITTFDSKGITKAILDFKKLDSASGKAGTALQTVDAGATKFAKAFGKMAAIGSVAVGVIGKGLVDAALESQKVMKQTQAIVTATGGAAGITAEQVGKLSDKLSKQTAIDDELIQTSANLLLTFKAVRNETGKGNQIFDRAVQAALDLGNVFGSADAAAVQLGKALSDPVKGVTALKKAGVDFTQAQKDQIKTLVDSGKVLDAQKLILKEVESQVGGTAAASATDFDRMKVAVGNVAESLGGLLLPVLESASRFVMDNILPVFENFAAIVGSQGVGAGVNYLVGSVVNGIGRLGTMGKLITGLIAGFAALRVATITYTAIMGALNIITTVSSGAMSVLIARIGAAKIAMLAAGGVTALLSIAAVLYGTYAGQKAKAAQKTLEFTNALLAEGTAQSDAFKELTKNNSQMKIAVASLGDMGISMADVTEYTTKGTGKFKPYVDALKTMDATTGTSLNKLDAYAKAIGIAANATTSAGGFMSFGLSEFARMAKIANAEAGNTAATMALLGKIGITAGTDINTGATTVETAKTKFEKFTAALKGYGSEAKQLASATKGIETANRTLTAAIQGTTDANAKLAASQAATTKAQTHFNQVTTGYGAASKQAADAQRVFAQAQRDGTRAGIALADAQQSVADAQRKLADLQKAADPRTLQEGQDAITEATYRVSDAEAALAEAQATGKQKDIALAEIDLRNARYGLTDATDALAASQKAADPQALIDAQEVLTQAELDLTEKQQAQKDATDAITTAQTLLNEQINGAAVGTTAYNEALDLLNQAKADEKDAAKGVADAAQAEIDARDGVTEAVLNEKDAKLQLAQAERELSAAKTGVDAKQIATAVKQTGIKMPKKTKKAPKGKAVGGSVFAGTPYIVGERGRELFIPSQNGSIKPNNELANGDIYNITINSKIADATLPDLLVGELRKFNRRSGAINIQVA